MTATPLPSGMDPAGPESPMVPVAAVPAGPDRVELPRAAKPSRLPLIVAGASLLVAVIAVGTSAFAVLQAQEARRQADLAVLGLPAQAAEPGGNPPPSAAASASPSRRAGTPGPTPTPEDLLTLQASFTPKYTDQLLTPQATSSTLDIDIDEPRVDPPDDRTDISLYRSGISTPYFSFRSGVKAALVPQGTNSPQPKECAEMIRTGPINRNVTVPAQRDTVLCILTSLESARQQGIKQRIVVVHVTDLTSSGKVSITLNAWEAPDN